MAVEKLSISVPADVAEAIRSAARAEGIAVSAWVASAAREKAAAAAQAAEANAAAQALLADAERAHGPATAEAKAWAAQVLASSGLLARSTRTAG